MIEIIKKYFIFIIIIILVILLFISRNSTPTVIEHTVTKTDTLWKKRDTVYIKVPKIIKTIEPGDTIFNTVYLPDSNYQALLSQYKKLLILYLEKNVIVDTLKIREFGYISITDTVTKNLISSRRYDQHIKLPEITQDVVQHRNQLYIGGGLQGNFITSVDQLNLGLMLKNKKDQLYGVSIGMNTNGQLQYGISSYWKISFRRNDR